MTIGGNYGYDNAAHGHAAVHAPVQHQQKELRQTEETAPQPGVQISEAARRMANAADAIRVRYNPRSISPDDLAAMAKELHSGGLLGERGMLYLSILPDDYAARSGETPLGRGEATDMIAVYEKKMAFDRENGINERVARFDAQLLERLKEFAGNDYRESRRI